MGGVPPGEGFAEPSAQLVEDRLGNQRHGHLPVTDIQIHGPRPAPSQGLMGVEELLYVPSLGIVRRDRLHFVPIRRREEGSELVLVRPLSSAMGKLKEGPCFTADHLVGQFRGSEAGPPARELLSSGRAELLLERPSVFHRHQQLKGCVELDIVEQLRGEMFQIGQHQQFARLRGEDFGHQTEQLDAGLGRRARGGGGGKTDWLMGVGIEGEKGLADPERPGFLVVAISPHVPLAIAADAMRIDRQKFADVIPRGPADASQGNLQSLLSRPLCGHRATGGRPDRWPRTEARWPTRILAGSAHAFAVRRCYTARLHGATGVPIAAQPAVGVGRSIHTASP